MHSRQDMALFVLMMDLCLCSSILLADACPTNPSQQSPCNYKRNREPATIFCPDRPVQCQGRRSCWCGRAFEDRRVARSAASPPVPDQSGAGNAFLAVLKEEMPGNESIMASDPIFVPNGQSAVKENISTASGTTMGPLTAAATLSYEKQTSESSDNSAPFELQNTTGFPSQSEYEKPNLFGLESNKSWTAPESVVTDASTGSSFIATENGTTPFSITSGSSEGWKTSTKEPSVPETSRDDETLTTPNMSVPPADHTGMTLTPSEERNTSRDPGLMINSSATTLTPTASEGYDMYDTSTSASYMSSIPTVSPGTDFATSETLASTMTAYDFPDSGSGSTEETSSLSYPVTGTDNSRTLETSTAGGTEWSASTEAGSTSKEETPLSFVIDADYKQLLNDSVKKQVLHEIRQQIAAVLKVPARRITNLTAEPGSIVVRFTLLGARVVLVPRIQNFVSLCNQRRFFIFVWRRRCVVHRPVCIPCINFPVCVFHQKCNLPLIFTSRLLPRQLSHLSKSQSCLLK